MREVIGVLQDVRENGIQEQAPLTVYWPTMLSNMFRPGPLNAWRTVTFVIRSDRTGTEAFLNQVRQAVWSANSNLPVASVRAMQDIYDRSLASTSFTLVMLAIAGAMALVLGIIGIYGVISYGVATEARDRYPVGAGGTAKRTTTHVRAPRISAVGNRRGIGLVAAAGLMRMMRSLLFGISPLDPLTYVAVPVVLVAAALFASYLPARRAAEVDPVRALKAE